MISFQTLLSESRSAPLYHGTSLDNAEQILRDNEFKAKTLHPAKELKSGKTKHSYTNAGEEFVYGVSLTRAISTTLKFGNIVFVLDQTKVIQSNRITPFQFFGHHIHSVTRRNWKRNEFEEFVVGPIKNADKVILKILIPEGMKEFSTSPLMKFPNIETYDLNKINKSISR